MGNWTESRVLCAGFNDVFHRRQELSVRRDFGEYVMENTLFKVAFPCESHCVTAVEAAFRLHAQVVHRVDEVSFFLFTYGQLV